MDAGYFRTDLDNGLIPPAGLGHLTLVADRALAAVGKYMLFSQSPSFIAEMYLQKLFAFLFVGNREWIAPVTTLRSWRVFLIIFSLSAIWQLRDRPILWILGGLLAYQTVAHLPALYSYRYSVSALELSFVLLAGIGLATFFYKRNWLGLSLSMVITSALIYAGFLYAQDSHLPKLNIYRVPHEVLYSIGKYGLPVANLSGAIRVGTNEFVSTENIAVIDIDLTSLKNISRYTVQLITIEGSLVSESQKERCKAVSYFYRKRSESAFSTAKVWQDIWLMNGKSQLFILGNEAPLEIFEPGTLRLQFACGIKTQISLTRLEVVRPTVAEYYRKQYLNSIGAQDWVDVRALEVQKKNRY